MYGRKLFWTVAILLGTVAFQGCQPDTFRGTEMPDGLEAPDFQLIDQHHQPFQLSRQKGNIVLLFFGYTFCPDVCPLTLSHWKKVHDLLGSDTTRVKFVYITVDPERDTPEQLAEHLSIFSKDFIGLTGSPDDLNPVYDNYGVIHEKVQVSDSAAGYLMNHSARINLVDRQGHWRLTYAHDTDPKNIAHDIKLLLKK